MKRLEYLKNKKGFTLIELIVVIAILGILMLILVPSFLGYADDAKLQVAKANTRTVWTAAKAAESKSEYTAGMLLTDCPSDPANSDFCKEIKNKLGTSFTGTYVVILDEQDSKDFVSKVQYTTNGKTCIYDSSKTIEKEILKCD